MTIEQPQEESIADRIASQFEDQPEQSQEEQPEVEAQAETEEAEAQPEVVEVEFGGKSYQVPPELKDALMAQSDYTKKTTEVAEKARLVELEQQQLQLAKSEKAFETSVKDDILAMQEIDFQIKQYKNIDATGLSSDQLWQLSRTIDGLKEKRSELSEAVTARYNQYQQEAARLAGEVKAKALEIAQKSIPNWSEQTQKQLRDYAASVGFRPEEVSTISDPRVAKVLWQASQYAKLQSAKVTNKVTNSPAVKPGSSNPMPQAVKDNFAFKKAMKSAPTSQAKAKAIEQELMRRF
jgi:hypothetical protein